MSEQTIIVHDGQGKNPTVLKRSQYAALCASGMLWEFHPDAPLKWPYPDEATPSTEHEKPCEGCGKPATHSDSEGVPLCKECYDELPVIKDETQTQPAPVLPWHREATAVAACDRHPDTIREEKRLAKIIAAHDPHAAHHATTVRLLEDMIESARHWIREANRGGAEFNWEAETYEARAHLVSNPQQEGAAK